MQIAFSVAKPVISFLVSDEGRKWRERVVEWIEPIPIGSIAVSVARSVYIFIFGELNDLEKNLFKALAESVGQGALTTPADLWWSQRTKSTKVLNCRVSEFSDIGTKESMQDAHFSVESASGVLMGVFDGHEGNLVANYAKTETEQKFLDQFNPLKPRESFEKFFKNLQAKITQISKFNGMGATAVLTYLDKNTGIAYTATIGDAQSVIYRDGKTVPLSCVRKGKDNDKVRSLGHKSASHKPKITQANVLPGDVILAVCDEVRAKVKNEDVLRIVRDEGADLAHRIGGFAMKKAEDNVTVLALEVAP